MIVIIAAKNTFQRLSKNMIKSSFSDFILLITLSDSIRFTKFILVENNLFWTAALIFISIDVKGKHFLAQ